MDEKIAKLKKWVEESDNIVFFGGAGVSTESGIPDFRSTNGLYHQQWKYNPETILSHSFFEANPEEYYRFYRAKLMIKDVKPNITHLKLAELEKEGKKIKGIRLSLEEGHCGLMYKVRYVGEAEDTSNFIDHIAKTGRKQLHIFVQNDMAEILNKTKIEYKEENLKRGLVFTNPRETGRCSCGKNFFTTRRE